MIHRARPLTISHSSLPSSGRSGARGCVDVSGERKEDLLEARVGKAGMGPQLAERPDAAHAAVGQKDETIADALGVGQLMNREDERAAVRGLAAQHAGDRARLAEIE